MRKVFCLAVAGLAVGTAAAGAPGTSQGLFHAPRIPVAPVSGAPTAGWQSSNWSGYAITGSGFHAITGKWVVPAVSATRRASYSSSWIGIDGFNNSSLIQTGTEQDYVAGTTRYDAWWEILPAAETVIPSLTIHPGDAMSAAITHGSGSSWTITITDNTSGKSFTITKTYTGPQTSAEWIQEAPTVGGRVATLAHYGQATFDPGTVNGANPGLITSDSGVMVQNGAQVSTPSLPDGDTDGFNVAYGSTVPAPPSS